MPIIPLYLTQVGDPDASRRVTVPGGYEWWHFYARDEPRDIHLIVKLAHGSVFDARYARAVRRYLRRPTRRRPPLPADYASAQLAVYQRGRLLASIHDRCRAEPGAASDQTLDVRIGPNQLTRLQDGTLNLSMRSAQLTFRPPTDQPPPDCALGAGQCGGAHHWIAALPFCHFEGEIHLPGAENLRLNGPGYHDHHYGSGLFDPSVRWWMSGQVLFERSAAAFQMLGWRQGGAHHATLLHADAGGSSFTPVALALCGDWRRTWRLLPRPGRVALDQGLLLHRPRIVSSSFRSLRLTYDALCRGQQGQAWCDLLCP